MAENVGSDLRIAPRAYAPVYRALPTIESANSQAQVPQQQTKTHGIEGTVSVFITDM